MILAAEYLVGWQAILVPWSSLQPVQLVVAVILVLISYGVRTLRLVFFFSRELRDYFSSALKLMLIHNFWNTLLPMRTGEISFPILMQRYFDIRPARSLPALFWFRLLDLYVVLMLGVISLMLTGGGLLNALLTSIILTAIIPLCWKMLPALLGWLETAKSRRISLVASRIRQSLPDSWRLLAMSTFWTVLNWAVKLAVFVWVLQQFVSIDAGTALLGAIAGELSSVLPVHGFAGAGTYEAAIVVAMIPSGMDPQQALLAAVNLHIFLLSCALLSGLLGHFLPGKSISVAPLRELDRE